MCMKLSDYAMCALGGAATGRGYRAAGEGRPLPRHAQRVHQLQVRLCFIGKEVHSVTQTGDAGLTSHITLCACRLTPFFWDTLCRLADSLAAQLGTSPGLPSRGAAAITAELQSVARRRGHCYLPWGQLQSAALTMLMQTGLSLPAWDDVVDLIYASIG
jgi:hypothetical protein